MFTASDIQARIKKQPFIPVRIVTSSGEHYDVTHPELLAVGKRTLFVGDASEEAPSVYDRFSIVSLMHVTALEDLPKLSAAPTNGQ